MRHIHRACGSCALALLTACGSATPAPSAVRATIGSFAAHRLPFGGSPGSITLGPDGALWFLDQDQSANHIGRITVDGHATSFPLPAPFQEPFSIVAGPDGALWFTDLSTATIGRITTAGSITSYPSSGAASDIAAGPDGALWYAEPGAVGRISVRGLSRTYPIVSTDSGPQGITAGSDGALWFTNFRYALGAVSIVISGSAIGRMTTSGAVTTYPLPASSSAAAPSSITSGPDGALWFTEAYAAGIGRITTTGAITEYPLPQAESAANSITAGPDGAIWFTETTFSMPAFLPVGKVGRIDRAGAITEYTMPSSTSVSGIATGPDGALWISDSSNDTIWRLH